MKMIKEVILKNALINAYKHKGKARMDAVLSKVLAENKSLRKHIKEIIPIVKEIIDKVNSISIEEQKKIIYEKYPEALLIKRREERKELPPLPDAEKYNVIKTRFAPNPDFDIHIGNARAAILSFEYARMYRGKFILRFEDTDPKTKTPIKEAYNVIKENLRWLGIKWDEEYVQSLRMKIYYEYAKKLIEKGGAYICTCNPKTIKELRERGVRCKHANQSIETNLELWDKMIEGAFNEQEAVLRIKTDPKYPNPSVRDWIAFRIINTSKHPHPLVGDKYIVWPTYNFACGIDDHLMRVTHILRAKEHLINTVKQSFLYSFFKWKYPTTIHHGRLSLEGVILSKSRIRKGINQGKYAGWDDIRLATISALRRRGFMPEAIRDIIISVGIKPTEARISLVNLYAINRKYLEPIANRYMFVREPVKLIVDGCEKKIAKIPYHPSYPEKGSREIKLDTYNGKIEVFISKDDLSTIKEKFRLIGLCNATIIERNNIIKARAISGNQKMAHKTKVPIIQWVPKNNSINIEVLRAFNNMIIKDRGLGEPSIINLKSGDRIQFIRYGFVRIETKKDYMITGIYIHN